MEEAINKRFGTMKDVYESGANFFPTTVFIDLKWGMKTAGVKDKNMTICVPMEINDEGEQFLRFKKLGIASATMFKLGLVSEPEQIMIASEAYASMVPVKDAKKAIKEGKEMMRPSEDPDRIDVAIVHAQNKANQALGAVREIVSRWQDSNGTTSLIKDLAVTPRLKKNEITGAVEMKSALLEEYWKGYAHGLEALEEERKNMDVSYASFIEAAKEDPSGIMNDILEIALSEKLT